MPDMVSVRKAPLETDTLAVLQHHLLTDDHARLFADAFRREAERLTDAVVRDDEMLLDRLVDVTKRSIILRRTCCLAC